MNYTTTELLIKPLVRDSHIQISSIVIVAAAIIAIACITVGIVEVVNQLASFRKTRGSAWPSSSLVSALMLIFVIDSKPDIGFRIFRFTLSG